MKAFLRYLLGQRLINYYHLFTAVAANFVYGFPSRHLHVIGVTGTDGKTTTTNLIASIFQAAQFPVSFLSTINAQIGTQKFDTGLHTTTPSPFLLQRLLREAVGSGSRYFVMEVTSHALDQYRTWGVRFESAVLTNITHEHLDYHKTYDQYLRAKLRLFQAASRISGGSLVLNADDQSFAKLSGFDFRGKNLTSYGLESPAQVWADQLTETLHGSAFTLHRSGQPDLAIKLELLGGFNVLNALAAVGTAQTYHVPDEAIRHGLAAVKSVAGRLELITAGQNFGAMVDFAHTPNALKELLNFLRPKVTGKLIVVFGSAGERDQTKRPLMGKMADQFADIVIVTREDNRSESIDAISKQIASGIIHKKLNQNLFLVSDRRAAIALGLQKAQMGDLVVATGKGHEQSLNIDGKEVPWDDREVMREELKKVVGSRK